jgi:hypothetical protein
MEDDVIDMSLAELCGSPEYFTDVANSSLPVVAQANRRVHANADVTYLLTAQAFRRVVKRNKAQYADLKDDKYFSTWNYGFVATSHMHHINNMLDKSYHPTSDIEMAVFKEIQTLMYAVLEVHLKTDKGQLLVSQVESTRDAQSIYRELKKHAQSSTAAKLYSKETGVAQHNILSCTGRNRCNRS